MIKTTFTLGKLYYQKVKLISISILIIFFRSNLVEGPGVFDYDGCKAEERVKQQSKLDGIRQTNFFLFLDPMVSFLLFKSSMLCISFTLSNRYIYGFEQVFSYYFFLLEIQWLNFLIHGDPTQNRGCKINLRHSCPRTVI